MLPEYIITICKKDNESNSYPIISHDYSYNSEKDLLADWEKLIKAPTDFGMMLDVNYMVQASIREASPYNLPGRLHKILKVKYFETATT